VWVVSAALASLVWLAAPRASALSDDGRQPLESITAAAIGLLTTLHEEDPSLEIRGGKLDERLRLVRCEAPLEANLAPGSREFGRVTVRVGCPATPAWRVHVQLDVSRERTLWTLARRARRGETLSADMLRRSTVTLGRGESLAARSGVPVESPDAWLGHEFVRDAAADGLLLADMLAPRRLIERGAVVRLRAVGAGLAIETRGVALADAALEERVSVRNARSGRVIEGVAVARGVVEIGGAR